MASRPRGTNTPCRHQTTAAHSDHAADCVSCIVQPELMTADWCGEYKLTAEWSKSGRDRKSY